jgi:hypothetical protein
MERRTESLLCLFLCGCLACSAAMAGKSRGKPVTAPGSQLVVDGSDLKSIEVMPTQGANMESVGYGVHAGVQSAASTPGYTAGAGVAGSMLGVLIAKSIQDSSLRNAANKPVEPLRAAYAAQRSQLELESALTAAWNEHAYESQRCSPDDMTRCETRLTLRPVLRLLPNARILCIAIEAKVQDRKGRSLYASRFNYLSQPAVPTRIDELNDYWSGDDFRPLIQEWSGALQTLMPLLASELERREKPAAGTAQAIRYVNAGGLFYDRGTILSQDEHRVVYRSLDGDISVVHVDRFVGTDEYYKWLTAPRSPAGAEGDTSNTHAEAPKENAGS